MMGRMRLAWASVGLMAAAGFLSLAATGADAEGAAPWPVAAPETAGFDSAKLAEALEKVRHEVPNLHGVVLEVDGKVILDATVYPYDGDRPHNLASVTKSVMTTLIAIAAGEGKLNLDAPMVDFFPGRKIAAMDARKQRITVRMLTAMTSGLDCVGEHDEPTLHQMTAAPDWVQFALDLKVVDEPGTRFSYCSPEMHLLSAILQQATGQTALDYGREKLFGPLGIQTVNWPADPQGVTEGWGDLHLYAADAARIGQLWLNHGAWEGRQIVPADWVAASVQVQTRPAPPWSDDYGYGWWVMTGDAVPQYAAVGRGGQRVGVFPTLNAVAVTVAGGIESGDVLDLIGTALVSPGKALPPNPAGERRLAEAIAALRVPDAAVAVGAMPPMARRVSGRTYRFGPNALNLQTIRLDFDGSRDAGIRLTFGGGMADRVGRVGLDGVLRFFPGEDGSPAGMRGAWRSDDEFVAVYDGLAEIDAFDLALKFGDGHVTLRAKDRTYEAGVTLEGRAE